jgi:predicted permease
MGQECRFLSGKTERELATAGRLPLVALTLVIASTAGFSAAVLRRRVHPDDGNLLRGLIVGAAVLGAVLSWIAYGPTGLFAAFSSLALGFVAILVVGAMTLMARGGDTGRRPLWAALTLEVAFIALVPLAVAFATGVSQSSVCMS